MLSKYNMITLTAFVMTLSLWSICLFWWQLESDMVDYKAEGVCINDLVSKGISRKNIGSDNGTCWIQVSST